MYHFSNTAVTNCLAICDLKKSSFYYLIVLRVRSPTPESSEGLGRAILPSGGSRGELLSLSFPSSGGCPCSLPHMHFIFKSSSNGWSPSYIPSHWSPFLPPSSMVKYTCVYIEATWGSFRVIFLFYRQPSSNLTSMGNKFLVTM